MILLLCSVALFTGACARTPKNLFVLLPDSDGTAGQATIANQGGTEVLSAPGHAVAVVDQTTAPGKPYPIPEAEISRRFGPALAAQPEPPARFLLYFDLASTQLTEESERLLPEILSTIVRRQSNDVTIVGHTDRVGLRGQNYRLGLERAAEVKSLLARRGVDPSVIQVDSHGQDNPLVPAGDQVREPRNRRVEVTVR